MTAPLTPADCDLRDFRFMPWHVARFRQSDLVSHEDAEAIVAAIMLWGEAWHQVPAGSLPDDDKALARLAGYGRSIDTFLKVKEGALHGFVKCSDGRLYHPTVCENAREAWDAKLRQRWRTFNAAVRKHNERNPGDRKASLTFDQWLDAHRPEKVTRDSAKAADPQPELDLDEGRDDPAEMSRVTDSDEIATPARAHRGADPVPDDPNPCTNSDEPKSHTRQGQMSRVTSANVTRETASKGQGQGQGDSNKEESPHTPLGLLELTQTLCDLAGYHPTSSAAIAKAMDIVKEWEAAGFDIEHTVKPAIRRVITANDEPTHSLNRFSKAVRHDHARSNANGKPGAKTPTAALPPIPAHDDDDPRIDELRDELRKRCGTRTYDSWLSPEHVAFSINGRGLVLQVRSQFAADYLAQNLLNIVDNAARSTGLGEANVKPLKTAKENR
jgi:hypothetical protein